MSLIKRMRRQKAIYWQKNTVDPYGKTTFLSPVEIACRWEDGSMNVLNPDGEDLGFTSTVYVDRTMKVGDKLKLGELESDTPDDPESDIDAHVVQRFDQVPNIRNTETLKVAYL